MAPGDDHGPHKALTKNTYTGLRVSLRQGAHACSKTRNCCDGNVAHFSWFLLFRLSETHVLVNYTGASHTGAHCGKCKNPSAAHVRLHHERGDVQFCRAGFRSGGFLPKVVALLCDLVLSFLGRGGGRGQNGGNLFGRPSKAT